MTILVLVLTAGAVLASSSASSSSSPAAEVGSAPPTGGGLFNIRPLSIFTGHCNASIARGATVWKPAPGIVDVFFPKVVSKPLVNYTALFNRFGGVDPAGSTKKKLPCHRDENFVYLFIHFFAVFVALFWRIDRGKSFALLVSPSLGVCADAVNIHYGRLPFCFARVRCIIPRIDKHSSRTVQPQQLGI